MNNWVVNILLLRCVFILPRLPVRRKGEYAGDTETYAALFRLMLRNKVQLRGPGSSRGIRGRSGGRLETQHKEPFLFPT